MTRLWILALVLAATVAIPPPDGNKTPIPLRTPPPTRVPPRPR